MLFRVMQACRFYRMDSVAIPTLYTGEIDYDILEQKLREGNAKPAIINCNIGTTGECRLGFTLSDHGCGGVTILVVYYGLYVAV